MNCPWCDPNHSGPIWKDEGPPCAKCAVSGRDMGIILCGQAELLEQGVATHDNYGPREYLLSCGPVTLCDTRPLARLAVGGCVARGRKHVDRIVRMRNEWVARGCQNA